MQFQQLQLLQAQIAANQLAQQQAQQQHQPQHQQQSSFIAPRFQALAAQHDDTAVLGPSGRPQLAPTFTFGAKQPGPLSPVRDDVTSPSQHPVTINRSEGIGGAAATGLAGLAARAHRRTGSEISPAMQQQLELQEQIEALQAKQKALMQEEAGAHGSSPLQDLSNNLARHRRVQSSLPTASLPDQLANPFVHPESPPSSYQAQQVIRGFNESQSSHNRRHSVNVFNKPAGHGAGFSIGSISDLPEGLPNGAGHHRSGSRGGFESGSWRSQGGGISGGVADLAAAQAQLQSLGQFRAAAGGGHAKMASFSFPNILPNLLAATTLQAPAGQTIWQQQQAFQLQLQQSAQGPLRKSLFAPYLPQTSLPPLLAAGKLVVGVLRVNKKNRSDAYVATDVLDADIYISGSRDRNRALEGDIVAVELLDVDEVWVTKKDKEDKKRKKEESGYYDTKPHKRVEKKKDDVEVEGQGLTLFEDEEVTDEARPAYAGHVVAVVERMPAQLFSGQLGLLRPSSVATKEKQDLERRERGEEESKVKRGNEAKPKIVWFKPTDKRVPLMAIPTDQAPADFMDNPDAYAERLFVACIKRWPISSLHPFGTLVEELGPIGDCEVETAALLKDCNFPTEDFSESALKCVPPLPFAIPERDIEARTDLRGERVFTIDPPNAKDLDDALSISSDAEGNYLVGVHIADVSYFVKTNSALDREARRRGTTVYLAQRAVPMLPPQLSEGLCSLRPGEERLAFSAMFIVSKDGVVLDKSFGRSVINRSCAQLSYSDVQNVITGSLLPPDKIVAHSTSAVEDDIRALYVLSAKLRDRRLDNGAMLAKKIKLSFTLDEEGRPIDCRSQKKTDSNMLVEEFMLLANTSIAQVIASGLPEQALLRRHEPPIERRLAGFVKRAEKLGYTFDPASAGTLQKSFEAVEDEDAAVCLELLKRKSMQQARYFCTGMLDIAKYWHWALNIPLYTHFTSPIRRYADVLVHRMLDACLTTNPTDVKFHMDRDAVAKCAQQCNMKRQNAKLAEDQSIHLYLCMLIHDLTEKYGPVVREARVLGVLDAAFDVFIPEFGVEKRVHVDKMPLENTLFDEGRDVLSLYWTTQDVLSYLVSESDDPHLAKIHARQISSFKVNSDHSRASDAAKLLEPSESLIVRSSQYATSAHGVPLEFDGLRISGGHKIQDVRRLMKIPVIVTSDMTKSPPVLVVYACECFFFN
ncbi:hypothetical protein TREMEDRAFT_32205 [Tremella mesenterica DSM 1558]|uniref:uncharacterized protein n=1 Tax=Tremella mesenterica (strain ATCC 24925 / CBS 8224 / DSM 1558 / NBRC 9311 / NRRL Y-6157 / RJB 2259-6 / UBC 559-6) TaxID=578456 RepID=UPI0003F48F65|nr:uncharacterized protein TREMEDRAFT_32205 [Tremella mesenterica DSM 1558]EIW68380.1 hypothetical protein TREMEDRAFT_32205 [Tremella mesenterica DSM 1558]